MGRRRTESSPHCFGDRKYYLQQELKKKTEVDPALESPSLAPEEKGPLHADSFDEPPTTPEMKKSVSFASLEVRLYNIVIGDHPYCVHGCPVALGWDYADTECLSVDQYEATREPRRTRQDLRLSSEERREILAQDGQFSEMELKRAERRIHRARSCSAKLSEKMNDTFFQDNLIVD